MDGCTCTDSYFDQNNRELILKPKNSWNGWSTNHILLTYQRIKTMNFEFQHTFYPPENSVTVEIKLSRTSQRLLYQELFIENALNGLPHWVTKWINCITSIKLNILENRTNFFPFSQSTLWFTLWFLYSNWWFNFSTFNGRTRK